MQLYFIRHAQSANNDLYTRTGGSLGRSADPVLTNLGHRQAQILARYVGGATPADLIMEQRLVGDYAARHNRLGYQFSHLYCSLMTRAIQTGSYIAATTGLPLLGWLEIHERGGLHQIDEASGEDIGIPGPNRAYFEVEFPQLILPDSVGDGGWWDRPIETLSAALIRAKVVWGQLLERHGGTDDRVAVVSHAGFFQSLLTVLLSSNERLADPQVAIGELWLGISNTSISRFEIDDEAFVIRYLNRVDYLPVDLITG